MTRQLTGVQQDRHAGKIGGTWHVIIQFFNGHCQYRKLTPNRKQRSAAEWQGTGPLDAERDEESLNSCPKVWEYLQHAGTEGWELVSTVTRFNAKDEAPGFIESLIGDESTVTKYLYYDTMFLKRSIS